MGKGGNCASGMLATRCHQEPTRQKKGPGEGPVPIVSPGVLIPLGRGALWSVKVSECPLAMLTPLALPCPGGEMLHGGHPVPTLTHTDWAEDRASEWWGAHPLSATLPVPGPGTLYRVSFLPAPPGENFELCTWACLLAPTHSCPYPGRQLDS